jgi:hypothetical protein
VTDVLIYWRDYRQNWVRQFAGDHALVWHSNARLFEDLTAGDRLWLVTCGKNLAGASEEAPQAGFLVGVWQVQRVIANPGDDPTYPQGDYRYRVVADPSASLLFDEPVLVDHIVRPAGRDRAKAIGAYLQGPRRLKDATVRLLKSAAGPAMARHYLTGRQS